MKNLTDLFQDNIRLTTFCSHKWLENSPEFLREEILAEARMGLWKACITYDVGKGYKFSTYAFRVITNEIGCFMRKQKKYAGTISLDATISEDENLSIMDMLGYEHDLEANLNYEHKSKTLEKYEYLKLFSDGNTQREISQLTGLSQSYISRLIRKERKAYKAEIEVVTG
ncbi:MAG TPA: sigma-70 family RNA polymerase sigma factor [Ruminiclostridium sp.]|nr:sigma-70 family RNA polymerase sigma factor [Ruminiclostridium sp.]